MGLKPEWNVKIGLMERGARNLISDVAGVTVGHCTLSKGDVQTGVTAVLPRQGDVFHDKVVAASLVINGFGKSVGLLQIDEMGTLETPVLLTNTLSVGTVSAGLVRWMLERNSDIGDTTGTVNPVVCECNDGWLNDIRGLHVKEEHVYKALEDCRPDFDEGAVGAGRGMRCHGVKGGIGSASRVFKLDGKLFCLGALCLTNHASWEDLTIAGRPLGRETALPKAQPAVEDKGSVITLLATDAPLSTRQLRRICRRALAGLSRTGSICGNGSGEIVLAWTTANQAPHYPAGDILEFRAVHDERINPLFRAAEESVEESVLSSLFHAQAVTGRNGRRVEALGDVLNS
jgi:D-aminopeptidase